MESRKASISAFKMLVADLLLEDEHQTVGIPDELQDVAVRQYCNNLDLWPRMTTQDVAVQTITEWFPKNLPGTPNFDITEATLNVLRETFLEYETEEAMKARPSRTYMIRITREQMRTLPKHSDNNANNLEHHDDLEEDVEDPEEDDRQLAQPSNKKPCPIAGCSEELAPSSVKTHIRRHHPIEFPDHYPGETVVYYPCTEPGCGMLSRNAKLAPLADHLSTAHGIDPDDKAETNDATFLKRKKVSTLQGHLVADGLRLNAFKDRIATAEGRLGIARPGWVPTHGLNMTTRHPTAPAAIAALGSRSHLVDNLSALRTELAYLSNIKVGSAAKWDDVALELESKLARSG